MTNIEIRIAIEKSRLKKYEIAAAMGMAETSFSRMFRRELTQQQVDRIYKAIEQLTGGTINE